MNPSSNLTFRQLLTRSVDPFKALLILVVVLDHNDVAHALFPATFRPLTFHVLGFLLLPFVIGEIKLSKTFILDRIARYGVPQFWILTVSAALLWFAHNRAEPASRVVGDYVLALFVGSAPLVKESSGFLAYWFLPTLLGLVIVLGVYRAISLPARAIVLVCFIVAHLALVDAYFPAYQWVPLGLPIVFNIFILGLLFRAAIDSGVLYRVRWFIPPVFILSYGWLVYSNTWLEIAILRIAPITAPITFIMQDIAGLSGVLTVLLMADLVRGNAAVHSIGRFSLVIYLVHPLTYAAILAAVATFHLRMTSTSMMIGYGIFCYAAALFTAWCCAVVIARCGRVREWLTPREWRSWPPLGAFRALSAG